MTIIYRLLVKILHSISSNNRHTSQPLKNEHMHIEIWFFFLSPSLKMQNLVLLETIDFCHIIGKE